MGKIRNVNFIDFGSHQKYFKCRAEKDRLQKRQKKESCASKGWNLWILHVSYLCHQLCCYSTTGNQLSLHKTSQSFQKHFRNKLLVCQLKAG